MELHCLCFPKLSSTNRAQILCPRHLQFEDPNAFVYRLWIWSDGLIPKRSFADTCPQKGIRGRKVPIRATCESSLSWHYLLFCELTSESPQQFYQPKTQMNIRRMWGPVSIKKKKNGGNSHQGNPLKANSWMALSFKDKRVHRAKCKKQSIFATALWWE